jgi:hypothetical protein
LDAGRTALELANAPIEDRVEGVNLMPWLLGEKSGPVHEALYWRWRSQAAVLSDGWKFIQKHLEIAGKLERELHAKADTWAIPGLPEQVVAPGWMFSELHVERTLPPPPRTWQAATVHGHR